MPASPVKGDRVKILQDFLAKYRAAAGKHFDADHVFTVVYADRVSGRKRLAIGESPSALWANEVILAWGRGRPERKKALGVL